LMERGNVDRSGAPSRLTEVGEANVDHDQESQMCQPS
jgi:hypothetical protein